MIGMAFAEPADKLMVRRQPDPTIAGLRGLLRAYGAISGEHSPRRIPGVALGVPAEHLSTITSHLTTPGRRSLGEGDACPP
jgi:hypothetical protein